MALNEAKLNARRIAWTAALACLAACGGGGSGGGDSLPPATNEQNPPNLVIALSPDVTTAVKNRIQTFRSPTSSSSTGEVVVPKDFLPSTLLVTAVDHDDKPLLLGFAIGASTSLNAESTAHALVRISIGPLGPGQTIEELDNAIFSTSAFPGLVSAIKASLDSGGIPYNDVTVLSAISDVKSQLSGPKAKVSKSKALALPSEIVDRFPYNLFVYQPVPVLAVEITTASTAAGAIVENHTPIAWAAQALSREGVSYSSGESLLTAAKLINAPSASYPTVILPAAQSPKFSVRLYQSEATRADNIKDIIKDSVLVVSGNWGPIGVVVGDEIGTQIDIVYAAYEQNKDKPPLDRLQRVILTTQFANAVRVVRQLSIGSTLSPDQNFISGLQDVLIALLGKANSLAERTFSAYDLVSYTTKAFLINDNYNVDKSVAICLDDQGRADAQVCKIKTTTAISTAPAASAPVNTQVTLSATVDSADPISGTPPTGTVTFTSLGTDLCTADVTSAGSATCSFTPVAPMSYSMVANYSGDASYGMSSSLSLGFESFPSPIDFEGLVGTTAYPENYPFGTGYYNAGSISVSGFTFTGTTIVSPTSIIQETYILEGVTTTGKNFSLDGSRAYMLIGRDSARIDFPDDISNFSIDYGLADVSNTNIKVDIIYRDETPTASVVWSITSVKQTYVHQSQGHPIDHIQLSNQSGPAPSSPYKPYMVIDNLSYRK